MSCELVASAPQGELWPCPASEALVAVAANGYAVSPPASAQYIISSSSSSLIYTVAGSGNSGYSGDGAAATAADLNYSVATVWDAVGNLCIADSGNNVVRKVAAGTGIITTFAGNATAGYSGMVARRRAQNSGVRVAWRLTRPAIYS